VSAAPTAVLHPALETALSALLPTAEQTQLLRACLLDGDEARRSWIDYQARIPNLKQRFRDEPRSRRLAPLLLDGLERNSAQVDRELLTVLRTARTREELRSAIYGEVSREALTALEGIPFLVLKGAALGETLYCSPALRHSHDVDLLVRSTDRRAAGLALERAGFLPQREDLLVHENGLPILLHTRLFHLSQYHSSFEELWSRSLDGRLCAADNLVHACVHASYSPSRGSLQWVCDAYLLARRQPDWDVVLQSAARGGLALPLHVTLRYLATELHAPIPAPVVENLADAAARAAPCERDAALFGARQGAAARPQDPGWRERLTVARWLLFPSAAYVRQNYSAGGAALPWCYMHRLASHAAGRLWQRLPLPRALAPEERLLLALSKAAPGRWDQQIAREALRNRAFSWERLIELASIQCVQPLLANALEADEQVPRAVRAKLHRAHLLCQLRVARFLGALAPVTDRLAAESIPVMLLKGAALAATVYPPGMRPLNDLDLLVRRRDYDRVARILEECGFTKVLREGFSEVETLRDYHEIVFERRLGKELLSVDLHWQIYPADRAYQMSVDDLFREARPVELGPVRALAPTSEATLVHYATQLVNDGLRVKLSRVADLHALACSGLDWDRVVVLARDAGAAGATHVALAFAVMQGAEVPPEISQRLARACRGCKPATDLVADPCLPFHHETLRSAAVLALKPLFYGDWRHRLLALRALPLRALAPTAVCGLIIVAHAWARSTQRPELADRLRALAWHQA
jgi:hypothetical protein